MLGAGRIADRDRAERAEVDRRIREAALKVPPTTATTVRLPTLAAVMFDVPPAGFIVPVPDGSLENGPLDLNSASAEMTDPATGRALLQEAGFVAGHRGTWLRQGDGAALIVDVFEFSSPEGAAMYNARVTTGELLTVGASEFAVVAPPGRGVQVKVREEGVGEVAVAGVFWADGVRAYSVVFAIPGDADSEGSAKQFAQVVFDRARPLPT